jgi:hypothetical protein
VAGSRLYPGLVFDPDCCDWHGESPDDVMELADALMSHFSVIMGELDLDLISERSRAGQSRAYVMLREALALGDVWVRGLSIDEPDEVFGNTPGDSSAIPPTEHALVNPGRVELCKYLERRSCRVHVSVPDLLQSREYRAILRASTRPFDSDSQRSRLWREVLEPFSRTRTVNIYEPFVFSPIANRKLKLESSGIYWLLGRFHDRAQQTGRMQTVTVRGTYRDAAGRGRPGELRLSEATSRIELACRDMVSAFGEHLSLHFELVDRECGPGQGRPPHDRFWIGRTGNSPCRLLTPSNSVIQQSHAASKSKAASTLTVTSDGVTLRMRTREWHAATQFVAWSLSSN